MNLANFGKHEIKHVAAGSVRNLETFWENQNVVFIFFRRWGCMMCRYYAKQLSEIIPLLKNNNTEMVGIGCEELGSQEFLEGQYFAGELYYDFNDKSIYKAMNFKRFNIISVLASLLWADSRQVISEARSQRIQGNLAGDGLQTGGVVIVGKGGKLLYEFKQNGPGDHLPNSKILEILGLSEEASKLQTKTEQPKVECTDECTK